MLTAINNVNVFVAALVALVCVIAGLFVWRSRRKAAKASPSSNAASGAVAPSAAAGPSPVQALFREADSRLRLSPRMKRASLSSLPVFFVVGPDKSGKTSVVLHSGLDPELLAGQVYQGNEMVPTKTLNIWLARQALIVEISASLAGDPSAIRDVLKYLMPGRTSSVFRRARPARAILLCIDQAPLSAAATDEEIAAAARPWNQCLTDVASSLGVQLPVYVLFTRLDSVTGFPEFVSNLGPRETDQAVGATIRPFNPAGRGAYAEETARAVNSHFSQVVYSLCDSRVPLLIREQDRVQAAVQYQFPRHFQRLQKNLVQFLVEVAKPSQLRVSPFLRGFYFSGTRKVIVDRSEGSAQTTSREPAGSEAVIATTVLSQEQIRGQLSAARSPQPPVTSRENTEWLFVPALFDGVLFEDRSAQGVSATSSRGDRARALIFGTAASLGILLMAAFTVSYVRNRGLEKELLRGGQALKGPTSASTAVQRLEQLREPVDDLIGYRIDHAPFFMGWGLYQGNELLQSAQALYCTEMRRVFQPVMFQMAGHLQSLGNGGGNQEADFAVLKAYMMVTTHPDKADKSMADVLVRSWKAARAGAGNTEEDRLLPGEFRTYLALLPISDSQGTCINPPGPNVIESAQQHFRGLQNDHYQYFLQQAGDGVPPIDYNKQFPNDAVTSTIVKGCFTRQGWQKMQQILDHPEKSEHNDWVLGDSKEMAPAEIAGYRMRYAADYKKAWMDFLGGARVAHYSSLKDAATKLDKMSNQHFLLSLIGLASENTAVSQEIMAAFQPVRAVVPAQGDFQPAKDYLTKLNALKNRLEAAESMGPSHDQEVQEIRGAVTNARDSVDQISLSFNGETSESVRQILLEPVKEIPSMLGKQDTDAVNAPGEDLCRSYRALASYYPFSENATRRASPEDVDGVFQPLSGKMWKLYDGLSDSLDCTNGICRQKANSKVQLQTSFVRFFESLWKFSRLLYSHQQPVIHLQITVQRFNFVKKLDFVIDGKEVPIQAGSTDVIVWDLHHSKSLNVKGDFEGAEPDEPLFTPEVEVQGPWALLAWLYGDSSTESRRSGVFHWSPLSGQKTRQTLRNGHTKEYEIAIRVGEPPSLLDLQSLQLPQCKLPVAR